MTSGFSYLRATVWNRAASLHRGAHRLGLHRAGWPAPQCRLRKPPGGSCADRLVDAASHFWRTRSQRV